MADPVFLSNVRLSFPSLVEPRAATPESPKKYSADFLMTPDHPDFSKFMQEVGKAALEKWGEHSQNVLQLIQSDRKLRCYGSGAERINKKTFQPYDGYQGVVYISANRDNPPQMIGLDGKPVDGSNIMAYQALARKLYGGCYVHAVVRPWCQENKHGRAIRCDLMAVQFARDGEAFGEGVADVSNMFGAVTAPTQAAPVATGIPGLPPFPM